MSQGQDQRVVEADWRDRELESEEKVDSVQTMSESVKKRLRYMEKNPSLESVLSVVDSLAQANRLGFQVTFPVEHRTALEAARRVARNLDAGQLRVGTRRTTCRWGLREPTRRE